MTDKKDKQTPTGKDLPYEIPVEGSLGLLALGAVALKAWRKKRAEVKPIDTPQKDG